MNAKTPAEGSRAELQDAAEASGSGEAPKPADRRRCKRLALSFPIEVSGTDATGHPFCDHTVTSDVSDRGCRFDLLRAVRCGTAITIRVVPRNGVAPGDMKALRFEVVWVETSEHGWSIGANKLQPENIWHMTFPKKPAASPTR